MLLNCSNAEVEEEDADDDEDALPFLLPPFVDAAFDFEAVLLLARTDFLELLRTDLRSPSLSLADISLLVLLLSCLAALLLLRPLRVDADVDVDDDVDDDDEDDEREVGVEGTCEDEDVMDC